MSLRRLRPFALALLLGAAGPAAGQQAPEQAPRPPGDSLLGRYALQAWGLKEGLPQATVRAITQTRDGYLWLGT